MTNLYDPPRRECEYSDAELVALARGTHMWINAFVLVRPKDETLIEIGRWVANQLRDSPVRDDLIGQTRVAYLRVNAS